MIRSILIANRGEIASRVIRTCKKMGIRSIAVFSDADRFAPFVQEADTAVHIGASDPGASYLNMEKIIATASRTAADAIHPGYGFLSENANFARRCAEAGLIFIGPNPEAIEAMGSKSKAKTLMEANGVPIVPGYQGADQSVETLKEAASTIGFPVLLKATAGGGGKGMRIVEKAEDIEKAIEAAKRESMNAFGNDELIVEKYIASGRHIEFQIFGDQQGHAIHMLERECSIQRRYQKVIEESPSPVLDETLRTKMGDAAVRAAKALNYDNAGTVEFIFDDQTKEFYFLEVNTRLQVEHPVTEEVTGLDLVQLQIESAQGTALPYLQEEIKGSGYAIEVRLYAEDAANNFLPVTGKIERFEVPSVEGLRVETAIQSGSEISIFYDPMIAKLIVWDINRAAAHRKMQYVLRHLVCLGIKTNQNFLLHLLEQQSFLEGDYNTQYLDQKLDLSTLGQCQEQDLVLGAIAVTLYDWQKREASRTLLRSLPSGWRNNFNDYQKESFNIQERFIEAKYRYLKGLFHFQVSDSTYVVHLIEANTNLVRFEVEGLQYSFHIAQNGANYYVHSEQFGSLHYLQQARFPVKEAEKIKGGFEAPMPSQIVKILVEEGQKVTSGEGLIVLSSMKMENTIEATEDGVVREIYTQEGENVEAGFLLLKIESAEA